MKIVSLFSGAGGMDLGFQKEGYDIIWANEFDKAIWQTHETNFPKCELNKKSILEIDAKEIPDCDGIIGGPPCQSFSEAGAKRGTKDKRGQLFWEYIRILKTKKPKFFVAENVSGLLSARHEVDLRQFIKAFNQAGYNLHYQLYNAYHHGVAQSRERLVFVGIRKDLKQKFTPPPVIEPYIHLKDVIKDLPESVGVKNGKHHDKLAINAHEHMLGGFSSMYMSRNRVRTWEQPSFTILASARQIPIHPSSPLMVHVGKDKFKFADNNHRRLSVRECARIQGFPDNFEFHYKRIEEGYKMVGNAVPVALAQAIAKQIKKTL